MSTFVVSLAALVSLKAGWIAALSVGVLNAVVVSCFAEYRLARIIFSIDRIARGDRYTSLPELIGDGTIQVGTDYVYPRTTNTIIRNYLISRGIGDDAVEEIYVPFGEKVWGETIQMIRKFAGSNGAIVAILSEDLNVHFFRERARQGLDADILPVTSLSLGEAEMPALAERKLVGHMVAWTYLHTIDTPKNRAFIEEWRQFTADPAAMSNDPMEASWIGFQLWTQAVAAAGTTDVAAVRQALAGRSIRAPSGFEVRLDPVNQHLDKRSVIGRMDEKNVIWPVWISDRPIALEPWSQWLQAPSDAPARKARSA